MIRGFDGSTVTDGRLVCWAWTASQTAQTTLTDKIPIAAAHFISPIPQVPDPFEDQRIPVYSHSHSGFIAASERLLSLDLFSSINRFEKPIDQSKLRINARLQ